MDPDAMDLDDSDFYGDEDTAQNLNARVQNFNVDTWIHQDQTTPARAVRQRAVVADLSHLHNPYAGVNYAWQLTETVDAFLSRLPPRTTLATLETPWIYICNPYIPRVEKAKGQNQSCRGNEDEAPEEIGSRTNLVVEGGMERLELVNKYAEGMRMTMKPPSIQEREIQKERKRAADDILNLAHAAKVRAGKLMANVLTLKWMLFCPPMEVNEVWGIVAKATANNELGIAAKVAPMREEDDPRKDRLICVYTANFRDKQDVGRVLQKLRELRLVEARGGPIYYKPDAYTYIGISRGNPWGLRASLYSSKDILQS